jgi:hypothetical protein
MVGDERNSVEPRSLLLCLSSSNSQRRFRIFFAGGGAVRELA